MPLIFDFRSTTIWKAFILNSLAASIAIVVALYVKTNYDTYIDRHNRTIQEVTNPTSIFFTFIATFTATFLSFTLLHFIFGYGAGQLALS